MKILSENEYSSVLTRLNEIELVLQQKQKFPQETFYNNEEFLQVMNISKRTAHTWRTEGLIPYSQVGIRFYYKHDDILELINDNYNPIKKKMKG